MLPHRRSIRLKTHDYSAGGLYSVTIVAARRQRLFSRVQGNWVSLTSVGRITEQEWLRIPVMRPRAWLDVFVIMPHHFPRHRRAGAVGRGSPRSTGVAGIGDRRVQVGVYEPLPQVDRHPTARLWHRGFYEHWVRGSDQLARIRSYILNNPRNWGRSQATHSGW